MTKNALFTLFMVLSFTLTSAQHQCGGLTEAATSIDDVKGRTYTLRITIGTNKECSVSCLIQGNVGSREGILTFHSQFTPYPNLADSFNKSTSPGSDGSQNGPQHMNVISFHNLTQSEDYDYHCTLDGEIAVRSNMVFPKTSGQVRIVSVGDWDWPVGNVTAKYIYENIDDYDAVVSLGDYAYDLCNFGNVYMKNMIPVTKRIPFMATAGNHEGNSHCGNKQKKTDFLDYINRWNMPNKEHSKNLWYSFDIENVHFATVTTELFLLGSDSAAAKKQTAFPLAPEFGDAHKLLQDMLDWLKKDLAASKKKWKVIYFHRPYYTNFWDTQWNTSPSTDKNQLAASVIRPLLEPIVLEYGVDLVLAGDVHGSERMQPMRNGKIVGDYDKHHGHKRYHNPGAPIYLICGNAGEKGNPSGVNYPTSDKYPYKDASPWVNTKNHGFCDITFTGDSISYSFVVTDPGQSNGDILDSFVLTKSHKLRHR